jgi:hypothetical protein
MELIRTGSPLMNTQSQPFPFASVLFSSSFCFLQRSAQTEPTGAVASREPPLCRESTAHPQGEASALRARLGDAAACRPRAPGWPRPWCARSGRFWKMCSVGAQDGLTGQNAGLCTRSPMGALAAWYLGWIRTFHAHSDQAQRSSRSGARGKHGLARAR